MRNINEFTQFFPNPAISVFNRSAMKDFDLRIGPMYPSYWDIVNFGNSAKGSSGHKMRLAPLLAPTFSNLQLQEHTAIVPLRTIMSDYEDKFNYALHPDGVSLPNFTMTQLVSIYNAMSKQGISPIGSLFDFLGYPVFADLYKVVQSNLDSAYINFYSSSETFSVGIFTIPSFDEIQGTMSEFGEFLAYGDFTYRDVVFDGDLGLGFFAFLAFSSGYDDSDVSSLQDFFKSTLNVSVIGHGSGRVNPYADPNDYYDFNRRPTIEEFITGTKFETVDSAVNAYINYLYVKTLIKYLTRSVFPENFYTSLPFRAYWRFCYDFLQNGNYTDVVDLYKVYDIEDYLYSTALTIIQGSASERDISEFTKYVNPFNRLWDDDFFTSLLPSSKVDNAVEIPANSTVLDLAKLSAFQRFVMKLSYSSRYRDTVWNIFKVKPSDARLQQSSLISHRYHDVGIGETLQTSETSVSSVLGSFAGRGYSSGRADGYHVFCEEPCVLLSFVSLIPRASYADALHPLIHVTDTLDFPLPDMDVLGNQPIYSDLVSGNPVDSDTIIGYGRQYQEWLSNYNTVHGDFKTSLDYWQLTRRFNDTPVINDDFLRINDADDFDKIFSVPNAPHAFLSIFYNCKISRPVHRNVRILI